MLVAQNQQFFEVVHVIEAAKGRRLDLDDRCRLFEMGETIVEQFLPCGQAVIGQPIDEIGKGNMKDVRIMIGVTISEWHS